MKKFVVVMVRIMISYMTVYMAGSIYDYLTNGYWYWYKTSEVLPVYVIIVGGACIGFHIDTIIRAIVRIMNKKEVKPQFIVTKGGDLERP